MISDTDKNTNIDLNLLRVFLAVCRNGSITLAAEELNQNQSSVSHAIARFKKVVGDPLFIRVGRGIQPTSVAEDLYRELLAPMNTISQLLEGVEKFDAKQSHRQFNVIATDYIIQIVLGNIQKLLAPLSIEIVLKEWSGQEDESIHALTLEKADLLIDFEPIVGSGWDYEQIILDKAVCVVRKNHPRITDSLSLQQYYAEKHVLYSLRKSNVAVVDLVANEPLLARQMLTQQTSAMSMFSSVENSDAIGLSIGRYAELFTPRFNLQTFATPFESKPISFYMVWSKKFTNNSAHKWLRETIKAAL